MSKETGRILLIITFGMVLFVLALNFGSAMGFAGRLISASTPVLAGLALAFVLNIPMRFFEEKVFAPMGRSKKKLARGAVRPISLILTLILFLLLLALIFAVLIPNLIKAVGDIINNLNTYARRLPTWLTKLVTDFNIPEETVSKYYFSRESIIDAIVGYVNTQSAALLSKTASITISVASTVFDVFIAVIVAIYMLACKERVQKFVRRLLKNFTAPRLSERIEKVAHVAYNSFYGFIVGQFTDSLVLGMLCYVGMIIFGFPYAGVVAIVVAAAQMIPIIGGIISASVGTLLMLTQSPWTALTFFIYLIIIQQIEGNLIYPRIVGDKVGLPGILVVSSVIFLGNMFGILGVLIGIPAVSTLYAIVKIIMDGREKRTAEGSADKTEKDTPDSDSTAD